MTHFLQHGHICSIKPTAPNSASHSFWGLFSFKPPQTGINENLENRNERHPQPQSCHPYSTLGYVSFRPRRSVSGFTPQNSHCEHTRQAMSRFRCLVHVILAMSTCWHCSGYNTLWKAHVSRATAWLWLQRPSCGVTLGSCWQYCALPSWSIKWEEIIVKTIPAVFVPS